MEEKNVSIEGKNNQLIKTYSSDILSSSLCVLKDKKLQRHLWFSNKNKTENDNSTFIDTTLHFVQRCQSIMDTKGSEVILGQDIYCNLNKLHDLVMEYVDALEEEIDFSKDDIGQEILFNDFQWHKIVKLSNVVYGELNRKVQIMDNNKVDNWLILDQHGKAYILKALTNYINQLEIFKDEATDEDEWADYGNDLMLYEGMQAELKQELDNHERSNMNINGKSGLFLIQAVINQLILDKEIIDIREDKNQQYSLFQGDKFEEKIINILDNFGFYTHEGLIDMVKNTWYEFYKIKDKYDEHTVDAIIELGYPKNKKYILDLLKWTYDFHIPIANHICCYLESLKEEQYRILTFAIAADYHWHLLSQISVPAFQQTYSYIEKLNDDLKPLAEELKQFKSMSGPQKDFFLQNRNRWLDMITFPTYTIITKDAYGEHALDSDPKLDKEDVEFFALKCSDSWHRDNIFKQKLCDKITSYHQKFIADQKEGRGRGNSLFVNASDFMLAIGRLYLIHYQYHLADAQNIGKKLKKEINELGPFIEAGLCSFVERRLEDGDSYEGAGNSWSGLCRGRSEIEAFNQMFENILDQKLDVEDIDDLFKQLKSYSYTPEAPKNIPETHWWWFL